jgi:glycine/D-amino acid oxidase-like deaminating enzyme
MARSLGHPIEFLDREAVQDEVKSPGYRAGYWNKVGGIVDPARLAWGLRDAVLRLGVRLFERTPMRGLTRVGDAVEIRCAGGRVKARKVVLATNAFRSPIGRMRRATIPIWDYALMTEPLNGRQMEAVGWKNRQGIGDSANQFHYYRLTEDNRILWGGYDAIYHYGNRIDASMEQRAASFEELSRQFFETFPQLEGLRWTHSWGGPIASTTRFCMDVGTALGGRVSWGVGYTGLGVVATRCGARIALDLLDRPEAPVLQMRFVQKRALPWPPEPLRSLGVAITQRAMARSDRNEGREGPWLKLLDLLGVGFDS